MLAPNPYRLRQGDLSSIVELDDQQVRNTFRQAHAAPGDGQGGGEMDRDAAASRKFQTPDQGGVSGIDLDDANTKARRARAYHRTDLGVGQSRKRAGMGAATRYFQLRLLPFEIQSLQNDGDTPGEAISTIALAASP